MNRRRIALLAGFLAVVIVAGASAGYALTRGGGTTPTTALTAPRFVEETATAGIQHTYAGEDAFATGGGVAVFDCDGNGKPDIYVAGGSNPAALYRNDSPVGEALRFTQIPAAATDLTGVLGAYPIDIDGDGIIDLVVLRAGESELLRGLGGCRFERANERWGFDGGNADSTAFSATWEGAARLPTLAVGRYLKLDASGAQTFVCDTSEIVRPDASGARYAGPIALAPGYCALSMLFSDWDRSGRSDLRVSNDQHYYDQVNGGEQLWRVAPGEAPRLYTDADGWVQVQVEGMGIATYDLTGDGYPEVFLTSQAANRLQTLTVGPSRPTYRDIGLKYGVNATVPFTGGDILPSTAWHPEFQDVNNDGFVDLLITKGNIGTQPDYAAKDPTNLLIGQPDGPFHEGAVAAGIVEFDRSRGAALADFNLDGLLDLVEVGYGAPVRVWRNAGAGTASAPAPMGGWLAIRLTGSGPNRDAIGSWIEVKVGETTLRREVTIGGGHAGGQLGWVHFGLGPSSEAQVRVQWPNGEIGPWMTVTADQFVDLTQGAAESRPWQPPVN